MTSEQILKRLTINRYNLQTEPPANPLGEKEREIARNMGKVMSDVLSGKEAS